MSTKTSQIPKQLLLPKKPSKTNELIANVQGPNDIDRATLELGLEPYLLNLYLAAPIDLSNLNIGIDKANYIPRQISKKYGGRKSLYLLKKDEQTIAGVFISNESILIRKITRMSGVGNFARENDEFKEQYYTIDNKLVYSGIGKLKINDLSKGIGELVDITQTNEKQVAGQGVKPFGKIWILWSCLMHES